MATHLGKQTRLCFVFACTLSACLTVALSSDAAANLQQGKDGVLQCPWIVDGTYTVDEVAGLYWYKEGPNGDSRLMVSYFEGSISYGPGISTTKYSLNVSSFFLLIHNVANEDEGTYEARIKRIPHSFKIHRVNVSVSSSDVTKAPLVAPTMANANDNDKQTDGLSGGDIAGIIIVVIVVAVIIFALIFYFKIWRKCNCENAKKYENIELGEEDPIRHELVHHLKTLYQEKLNKIPTHIADELSMRTIDDMYVHPALYELGHNIITAKQSFSQGQCSGENSPRNKQKTPLKTVSDFMNYLGDKHRVALVGSAGIGRATIIKKIAYEWACERLGEDFMFVIALEKKDMNQGASGVCDAICKLLPAESDITKQQIKKLIARHQDKVLFLLEDSSLQVKGSIAKEDFSFKDLLSVDALRKCKILITMSPHQLQTLQKLNNGYSVVKTTGYDFEEMATYIEKLYESTNDALMEEIKSSEAISSLAKSPFMLLLLCIIWHSNQSLPKQNSDLYNKVVEALESHATQKGHSFNQDEIWEYKKNIGKVAFEGLVAAKDFSPSDFSDVTSALEYGFKIGALSKETVTIGTKLKENVEFLFHFRDYFAACYYAANSHALGNSSEISEAVSHLRDRGWLSS